jgi:succinate-acetate transporter protein
MLGLYNAGIIDSASLPIFLPVAFFFGGLVQLIVAVLEVLRGNVFGAAVFGTYGPFWIIFGAIEAWFAKMAPASSQATGVAVFLFMFAVVTGYFFMASLKTDTVLATIFALIFAALVLLGLGYAMGQKTGTAVQLGGWVTLIFGVLAWYRAAAGMINANFGREILPVGHLS